MHNNERGRARRRGEAAVAALVAATGIAGASALFGGTGATGASALAAAFVAAPTFVQSAPPASPPAPPAAAPAPAKPQAGPTAEEILDRAIARQGVPKGIDPAVAAPLELLAKTNLQFRDEKGNDVALAAERRFLAPDRIWTQLTDLATGTVTRTGYDGKVAWFWSKESGIQPLDGPDRANDLKQLGNDVEITSSLARALQLRLLKRELSGLRRLDDAPRGAAKVWSIEGDAQVDLDQKKTPTKVRLFVAPADAQLVGVRVVFEGRAPLQIWFAKQEVAAGFEFPHKIEVFRDGAEKPQVTIAVYALDLAPHLTDKDFAPK